MAKTKMLSATGRIHFNSGESVDEAWERITQDIGAGYTTIFPGILRIHIPEEEEKKSGAKLEIVHGSVDHRVSKGRLQDWNPENHHLALQWDTPSGSITYNIQIYEGNHMMSPSAMVCVEAPKPSGYRSGGLLGLVDMFTRRAEEEKPGNAAKARLERLLNSMAKTGDEIELYYDGPVVEELKPEI